MEGAAGVAEGGSVNRRGFLAGVIALAAAPAIVRADSLMKVVVPRLPKLWGDGVHDDTAYLQALLDKAGKVQLPSGIFLVSAPLILRSNTDLDGSAAKILMRQKDSAFIVFGRSENIALRNVRADKLHETIFP